MATTPLSYEALEEKYNKLVETDPNHENGEAWEGFEQEAKSVWDELAKRGNIPIASAAGTGGVYPVEKKEKHKCQVLDQGEKFFKRNKESGQRVAIATGTGKKGERIVPYIPFGPFDPVWAMAAVVGLHHAFTDRIYIAPTNSSSFVYPLPSPPQESILRVAVVGDLGTNDDTHKLVLKHIHDTHPNLVIHLGDIYGSGTPKECEAFWKIYENMSSSIPLWSIPGNHEYISAGIGYYTTLLEKKRLGAKENPQEASMFCLENPDLKLQLLALDTGHQSINFVLPPGDEQMDYTTSLGEKEAQWARERLAVAKDNKWRTIVLMHHQLVSSFWKKSESTPRLVEQIAKQSNNIVAWLWGHEHRLVVLDDITVEHGEGEQRETIHIRNAHCVGHGACPELVGSYDLVPGNTHKFLEQYTPKKVHPYLGHPLIYNPGFITLEVDKASDNEISLHYFEVDRAEGTCTEIGKRVI